MLKLNNKFIKTITVKLKSVAQVHRCIFWIRFHSFSAKAGNTIKLFIFSLALHRLVCRHHKNGMTYFCNCRQSKDVYIACRYWNTSLGIQWRHPVSEAVARLLIEVLWFCRLCTGNASRNTLNTTISLLADTVFSCAKPIDSFMM